MNDFWVSICIPTANLGERSLEYMGDCLSSIEKQDYQNIQVIVSDHSTDDEILNFVADKSYVTYHRNESNRGYAAANMNNAIDLAPKDHLIKMLFQDDILKTSNAISLMVARLRDTGAHWVGVGCNHIDDNNQDMNYRHPPGWVVDIGMAYGYNLIGSPSVVMFRNCALRMDPNLIYLNDCEFYYRMGQLYGAPALIADLLVTIRIRAMATSATIPVNEVKIRESLYIQKKYKEIE